MCRGATWAETSVLMLGDIVELSTGVLYIIFIFLYHKAGHFLICFDLFFADPMLIIREICENLINILEVLRVISLHIIDNIY